MFAGGDLSRPPISDPVPTLGVLDVLVTLDTLSKLLRGRSPRWLSTWNGGWLPLRALPKVVSRLLYAMDKLLMFWLFSGEN
jgi:hypothetical protein